MILTFLKSLLNQKSSLSQNIDEKNLSSSDICVVVTDHDNIDYNMILRHSQVIVDTRNVYKDIDSDKVIRLGQTK